MLFITYLFLIDEMLFPIRKDIAYLFIIEDMFFSSYKWYYFIVQEMLIYLVKERWIDLDPFWHLFDDTVCYEHIAT